MTYEELMEIICSSSADDWLHLSEAGVHTFRQDLNIRIERVDADDASAVSLSDDERFAFAQSWKQQVVGTDAQLLHYQICYGSSAVERFLLVAVDGGNAQLPMPDSETNVVSVKDYQIAKAIDYLGTLDNYIKHARLTIEEAANDQNGPV